MSDSILVLNAGSSSVKFSTYDVTGPVPALVTHGEVERIGQSPRLRLRSVGDGAVETRALPADTDHARAIDGLLERHPVGGLRAVGHRVVHGGTRFTAPVRVDAEVLAGLEALVPLAPLHQPHNLAPMRVLLGRAPALPQVACFDTAFHRTQPEVAQAYAVPRWLVERGVRRYGFHGLSYESIASRLPEVDAEAAAGRTVVLHLGNGASLCALQGGRSVATTMGFTALEGLPMGTRCGSLDPGVVLFLVDQLGLDVRAVEHLLYHESGLLGLSGFASDMRALEACGTPEADFAIEVFCHRIVREIGAAAAVLGGLDALVFTAGIGENSVRVRRHVGEALAWLGLQFDADANAAGGPCISRPDSRVRAWVLRTDEEAVIARHTLEQLS